METDSSDHHHKIATKALSSRICYSRPRVGHQLRFFSRVGDSRLYYSIETLKSFAKMAAAIVLFALVSPLLFGTASDNDIHLHPIEYNGKAKVETPFTVRDSDLKTLTPSQLQQVLFNLKQLGLEDTLDFMEPTDKNVPQRRRPSPKT